MALPRDLTRPAASVRRISPGREREVLMAAALGMTVEETGRFLHLSPHTVKTYRDRIMEALGARNMANAVYLGLALGFLEDLRPSEPPVPSEGSLRSTPPHAQSVGGDPLSSRTGAA
jgi:DNA-binding CsgD family transcriptional regulator